MLVGSQEIPDGTELAFALALTLEIQVKGFEVPHQWYQLPRTRVRYEDGLGIGAGRENFVGNEIEPQWMIMLRSLLWRTDAQYGDVSWSSCSLQHGLNGAPVDAFRIEYECSPMRIMFSERD